MAKHLNNQFMQETALKVDPAPAVPVVPLDLDRDTSDSMAAVMAEMGYDQDNMSYSPSGIPIPPSVPGLSPELPDFKKFANQKSVQTETVSLTEDQLYQEETSIGTKSDKTGGYRLEDDNGRFDDLLKGDTSEQTAMIGGTITAIKPLESTSDDKSNALVNTVNKAIAEKGIRHYEGSLGSFDYNPNEWAVGVKDIERNGSKTSVPVLRYIGEETNGDKINIPEGVTNLDYTFEGMDLETVPKIPDSVESAHAAFMDCKKLTRACKEAKDGEYDDTNAKVGGGIAAGAGTVATGLGAFGMANGWNPAGWVALGGAGLVAVGGGIYSWAKDKDGRGGTWHMPKNLKDASYMFSGCESLTEGFEKGSEGLMNVQNMYEGNADLGTDDYAIKKGSVAVTNFQETNVSKAAAMNAFDKANADIMASLGDKDKPNYSLYWNEDTKNLDRPDVTLEVKQEVEDLNVKLEDKAVREGYTPTDMSVATNGLASMSTVHGKEGIRYSTDINEKNEVQPNESSSLDGFLGNAGSLIDRGIVSFGEYKILKAVTGNALIAGVATFGLQAVGILPKSMKPVLKTVAKFVGEDSGFGKALNSFADKLPDASGSADTKFDKTVEVDARDATEKGVGDNSVASMDSRVTNSMNPQLGAVTRGSVSDITAGMARNGRAVANDGILLTAANKVSNDPEFTQISQMTMASAGAMEMKAIDMAGESGKLDDASKSELSAQYLNILRGFEAYDNAAKDVIDAKYGMGSADAQKAQLGLNRVMDAAVAPMLDSMKELDAQYEFIDSTLQKQLDSMNISGIGPYASYQTDYSRYGIEQNETGTVSTFDSMDAALEANAASLMNQPHAVAGTKIVQGDQSAKQTAEPAVENFSRAEAAEARFGDLLDSESEVETEVDFD